MSFKLCSEGFLINFLFGAFCDEKHIVGCLSDSK